MKEETPEKSLASPHDIVSPTTPETPYFQAQFAGFSFQESPAHAQHLLPSSLFRPWDTPESLSPTSSNVPSLSPTSSNLASSETSSPPQLSPLSSLPSSPEDLPSSEISPSQAVYSSNGTCLFKIEPLESVGQGVSQNDIISIKNENHDDLDFISGKDRDRKRKRKIQTSAASPLLTKKSRSVTKGDFPPCGVCGAASTGVHYGAAVCEGCKVKI